MLQKNLCEGKKRKSLYFHEVFLFESSISGFGRIRFWENKGKVIEHVREVHLRRRGYGTGKQK